MLHQTVVKLRTHTHALEQQITLELFLFLRLLYLSK